MKKMSTNIQLKATVKKVRFKNAKSFCLPSIGKEFHIGAIEEKALSPINRKQVKGTVKRLVSE